MPVYEKCLPFCAQRHQTSSSIFCALHPIWKIKKILKKSKNWLSSKRKMEDGRVIDA
jgi:hypothetical protein